MIIFQSIKLMPRWVWVMFLIVVLAIVVFPNDAIAQCPMCKISAESNLKDGGSAGKGLNKGILYMFVMPYLLVGTMAYLWYKNRKQSDLNH